MGRLTLTVIKGEGRKFSKIDNQVIKTAFPFFLGLFIFILALSKKEIQSTQPRFEINRAMFKKALLGPIANKNQSSETNFFPAF